MPDLSALAITSRSATVMICPEAARFHLHAPVAWQLHGPNPQQGQSLQVPVFLEGLTPDSRYAFETGFGSISFRTAPCAGLIDATDHGVREGARDNAAAFADAVAAVLPGGTLTLPPGRYATGPIFLKSNMTLYLPAGVEIAAIADRTGWPILPARNAQGQVIGTWEGLPEASFAAPVTALNCDDLTLTGAGTIDGGGDRGDWWTWPKETRDGARRPRTFFAAHCNRLTLSGLMLRNSPSWTVHPFHCTDLTAAALRIENPADSPNTDGFDPESCRNLQLHGLRISVGDDCIAVKSGKRGTGADTRVNHIAPTHHLTVANCLMQDGHGAVVLGSEMSGDITDVEIRNCEFVGTDRGLRLKTRRGRGGTLARLTMRNVDMRGVGTGLAVNAFYFCDADGKTAAVQSRTPAPVNETTPQIHDIRVSNVSMTKVRHAVAAFLGLPESPIRALSLHDIRYTYDPDAEPGETLMACHLPKSRHAGLLHRFAEIEVDADLRRKLEDLIDVE